MRIQRREQDQLTALLASYKDAKAAAREASTRLSDVEAELLQELERRGEKTVSYNDGSYVHRATFVRQTRVQVNEEGLKKKIGAVSFRKLCKQVFDRKLLEAALETGQYSVDDVSEFVVEVPGQPFLRYTTVEAEREDA